VSDCRWATYERWHREQQAPGSERALSAAGEYYRVLSAVEHALLRVKMLAGMPEVVERAEKALLSVKEIRKAVNSQQIRELGDVAALVADEFVAQAAKEVD
jgi:hypothetical protein